MNRKLRPARSTQQIKEKEISFLLEGIENNLEEYKVLELNEKQLSDLKKYFKVLKKTTIQ